jgi:hypothetical protein
VAWSLDIGSRLVQKLIYGSKEIKHLDVSPNVIRVIILRRVRWAKRVAHMEEMRNAYKILVGKPERKRILGRPKHRWEDNIRMDLKKTGREGVDWIHLAQDRDRWRAVVNTVMNLWVLEKTGNFLTS